MQLGTELEELVNRPDQVFDYGEDLLASRDSILLS